ncbi:MAG: hypothetical protein ABIH03_06045 [Pseudomonadota bacterium]
MITVAQGIADPKAAGIISTAYSKKLNMVEWPKDLIADITSSAYFDEAGKGDKVTIPVEPIVEVRAYTEGAARNPNRRIPATQDITIDQAWDWDEVVGAGTKEFSYVDLLKTYSEGGMKSARKYVHEQFFSWLEGKAADENKGANAGKKTGGAASTGYNLGTESSPVKVNPTNIVANLLKFTAVLGEQDIEEGDIAVILPFQLRWLYLQSELKAANVSGEDTSKMVTGYMGRLDGREKFYATNYATGAGTSSDPFCVFAMTKQAVAYTNRLTRTRLYEDANWDVASQGLGIWGRGIIKDWALCEAWFYVDETYAPWAA